MKSPYKAPVLTLPDIEENTRSLAEHAGSWVVGHAQHVISELKRLQEKL
jgi:hypothetical protein